MEHMKLNTLKQVIYQDIYCNIKFEFIKFSNDTALGKVQESAEWLNKCIHLFIGSIISSFLKEWNLNNWVLLLLIAISNNY